MLVRTQSHVPFIDTLLGVMKFIAFFCSMMIFLLHHGLVALFITDEDRKHKFFLKSMKNYVGLAQKILNIKIDQTKLSQDVQGSLIVANHQSYVDMLIVFTLYPSLFITSVEMKETFLLGSMTELGGCFFVERRKTKLTAELREKEISSIITKLEKGFNVFLFPEGTSSDGAGVLPFKANFFQLAEKGVPIVPLCLKYLGEAKSVVPWFGKMTFPGHLLRVCMLPKIEAELIELPQVCSGNKFEMAQATHDLIRECYGEN